MQDERSMSRKGIVIRSGVKRVWIGGGESRGTREIRPIRSKKKKMNKKRRRQRGAVGGTKKDRKTLVVRPFVCCHCPRKRPSSSSS